MRCHHVKSVRCLCKEEDSVVEEVRRLKKVAGELARSFPHSNQKLSSIASAGECLSPSGSFWTHT